MPTYEYLCKNCEHRFEQMQKMSDDPLSVCPECSESSLQRLVNAAAFHLKGTGWYKTDYASSKSGTNSSSTSSTASDAGKSTSSDASTASKSDASSSSGSSSGTKKSSTE